MPCRKVLGPFIHVLTVLSYYVLTVLNYNVPMVHNYVGQQRWWIAGSLTMVDERTADGDRRRGDAGGVAFYLSCFS